MKNIVVYDLETTGLSPFLHEIIEIAGYKINQNFEIIDEFTSFVKPENKIPGFITGITHITNEMVENAPHPRDVLKAFREFSKDCILLAHNAVAFDAPFLISEMKKNQLAFYDNEVWDSLEISKAVVLKSNSYSLPNLTKKFDIKQENAHRALSDSKDLFDLMVKFNEIIGQREKTAEDKFSFYSRNCKKTSLHSFAAFNCQTPLVLKDFMNSKSFFEVRANMMIKSKVEETVVKIIRPMFLYRNSNKLYVLARVKDGPRKAFAADGLKIIREV